MKHEKRALESVSDAEMQHLRVKWIVCLASAVAVVWAGSERGSSLHALFSKAAAPLAVFFHYDIDAPMVALGVGILWTAAAIVFWGQLDDDKIQAQSEVAQNTRDQQRQEFEDDVSRIQRSNAER